jgi:hypothetical protein
MRTTHVVLLACLAIAAVLAGCASSPQQSTGPTVTTPDCGASAVENANSTEGANNTASQGAGSGACEGGATSSTNTTNTTPTGTTPV